MLQFEVHNALRQVAGWLLIFDNTDDMTVIRPWLPPPFLMPPGMPGHALVTTRRGGFEALGQVLDLDVLDPDAAVDLMSARVPALDRQVAQEVAESLGCLPLALEQAAAYMDRSQMPPRRYMELLNSRTDEISSGGHSDSNF